MIDWDKAFTSDAKKIAENQKLPTIRYEKEKPSTGCHGYWQGPDEYRRLSNIEDEQGL
jgi:hypothetical protein